MKKYLFLFLFLNLSVIIYSQVNADFSMAPPNGCSPLSVSFTDVSTGAVTNWDWTFGNGNTSTLQNPGAVFITPGNYPVCLTVTDGTLSDTFCDTVIVYEDPTINFIADDSIGCSDLTVNFTNLTITGTGIQSAFWNFGDGNTSNDINPNHTFTAGVYDITLIVTDNSGCIAQGDKLQYITATPAASADFSGTNTQSCGIPSTVNFTNTSTNDAGATYTWIFGDGDTVTTEAPYHIFKESGNYEVTLIAQKGKKSNISTQTIEVKEPEDCLVEVETQFGTMTILLYDDTPQHRDNFIKLVEEGFYNELLFHRVINGFMVQGGDPVSKNAPKKKQLGMGGPGYTVPAEFVDTLVHYKGALCAARMGDGANPEKASSGSH